MKKHIPSILAFVAIIAFIYMAVQFRIAEKACRVEIPVHHDWEKVLNKIDNQ